MTILPPLSWPMKACNKSLFVTHFRSSKRRILNPENTRQKRQWKKVKNEWKSEKKTPVFHYQPFRKVKNEKLQRKRARSRFSLPTIQNSEKGEKQWKWKGAEKREQSLSPKMKRGRERDQPFRKVKNNWPTIPKMKNENWTPWKIGFWQRKKAIIERQFSFFTFASAFRNKRNQNQFSFFIFTLLCYWRRKRASPDRDTFRFSLFFTFFTFRLRDVFFTLFHFFHCCYLRWAGSMWCCTCGTVGHYACERLKVVSS